MCSPDAIIDVSRRSFLRYASLAATLPILTEGKLAWAAQQAAATKPATAAPSMRMMFPHFPPDAVLINANENPLGPSASALKAISAISPTGGRYDLEGETVKLIDTFAEQNGLQFDNIMPYAGSSEPLHYSVLAFTSPEKGFVTADPSYEAGLRAAMVTKAKVSKVPLTSTYAHDVKAMVKADTNAGVIYICNPNNPTGTTTTREDILWALENKPAGSILLVDEAYIHLSDAHSVLDQVAAGKDLIVLRTFSKIYGMAGIRCGFAVGRPDLLAKLMPFGMNPMPVTAMAAARASLEDTTLVPTRKKIIADTRNDTFSFLKANNYKFIPSESNCFMIDTERNGRAVINAMAAKNIFIGRTWPIWPNTVRISVGTPEEMKKFQTAFKEVMSTPVTALERNYRPQHQNVAPIYA